MVLGEELFVHGKRRETVQGFLESDGGLTFCEWTFIG